MSKKTTTERIICGDNLEILKEIPSESVDLIYIDPPFFSGRNYSVIWGDGAEIRQFEDRWVKMGNKGKMSKDINVYLDWMKPRLEEIYRVLKKTGSFYLHCDWHCDSYLRVMCDGIFGYNNMKNKIVWCYGGGGIPKKDFPRKHDTILRYVKNNKEYKKNGVFNIEYQPYGDWIKEHKPRHSLTSGGKPLDLKKGTPIKDWWNDLKQLTSYKKSEYMGYPTQKPEALLERIIKASSNKGDVVLDAFCGCGTTLAVAKRLGRQFIGIDVSPTSCRLMAKRINKPKREVEGLPLTKDEIKDLSGWEFQNWINREFGAINGKRGADGGIDGTFEKILIQVKKYKVGRPDLDSFSGVLVRKDKKEGIFIGLNFTSTFIKEVSRLKRENEIEIHYFTVDDILEGKHKEFTYSIRMGKFLGKKK